MATGAQEQTVAVLAEEWEAIASLGVQLRPEEWSLPSECPAWTVRDLVAHMIGTERSLLGEPAPPRPAVVAPHVRNEVGASNEAWVDARRTVAGADLVAEFAEVTARRLADLRAWPAERFDEVGPSPVGMVPYREFMAVRVMDCWVHEQDIRFATGRPGHAEGPAATIAMARIASAMPFVVGRRAGAPEGASVRFEVRDPGARRIDVVVRDGRAVVADDLGGEPTATLAMDGEAFWRLGCGRISGADARAGGLAEVGGDDALAERVLGSMAFMI
jgi:uncharacterized protein (TIGR03083 family)